MSDITVEVGTQIRFFVTGSFSPADEGTNWTVGTPTDVVLTLAGVADAAARQSTKVDLGANRALTYTLYGCTDHTGETPTAGLPTDYHWAPSPVSIQGNGNIAGNSGADADAPGGALGSITLAEFLLQCIYIGSLIHHDGAVVQNAVIGVFDPTARFGQLIVVNSSGDVYEADDVEMHQVMVPNIPDVA